jgi:hypothetical protein
MPLTLAFTLVVANDEVAMPASAAVIRSLVEWFIGVFLSEDVHEVRASLAGVVDAEVDEVAGVDERKALVDGGLVRRDAFAIFGRSLNAGHAHEDESEREDPRAGLAEGDGLADFLLVHWGMLLLRGMKIGRALQKTSE